MKREKNLPLCDHLTSYPSVCVKLHGNTIDSLSIASMIRTESFESMRESALIIAINRNIKKKNIL